MVHTLALPYPRITQWDFYRAPQVPLPQGWQNRSLGHFQKGQNLTPTGDPNEPPPLLLSVSLTSDSLPQSGGGLNRPTQQHTSQVRGSWVFTWGGAWGVLGEPGLEKLKQPFRHSFSVFIIFVYTYFFLLLIVHTHHIPQRGGQRTALGAIVSFHLVASRNRTHRLSLLAPSTFTLRAILLASFVQSLLAGDPESTAPED